MTFIALHVQTANPSPASVCSIGWAQAHDGAVTGSGTFLCIPPTPVDWFANDFTTATDGLFTYDVAGAPHFDQLHPLLLAIIGDQNTVSHTPDTGVAPLAAASQMCGLPRPSAACTHTADRAQRHLALTAPTLPQLADHLAVVLPRHADAGQSAVAVAMIAIKLAGLDAAAETVNEARAVSFRHLAAVH